VSWLRLRRAVYRRDQGRCQVCLSRVGRLWDAGHLVDRCVGGRDELSNLVLMDVHCNRRVKPIHRTRAEALAWLRAQQEQARTGRELSAAALVRSDAFWRAMLARRLSD
jgi:5-methylcytosine-specific restriction endonuclease McrA